MMNDMTLMVIVGKRGSGKTLIATAFAVDESRPVYANYKINIPTYIPLTPSVLDTIDVPSLVIMDETYVWLDSRVSSSHLNRYLSQILFQSRKIGIDIICTIQLFSSIDNRFRELSDYVLSCKKLEDGFGYELLDVYEGQIVTKFKMPIKVAKKIYPYYDTLERINPTRQLVMSELESDQERLNEVIDEVIKNMEEELGNKVLNRQTIDDYVLRNGHPKQLGRYVYNRYVAKRSC